MKPTPEIIELAKQIWKKGWRQDIREGDWYMVKGHWRPALSTAEMGGATVKQQGGGLIPIPDLSTCLRWLDNQGYLLRLYQGTKKEELGNWIIWLKHRDSDPFKAESHIPAYAPTPEEACMLAMLKILEGEADQQRKDDEWEAIRPDPQEEGDK